MVNLRRSYLILLFITTPFFGFSQLEKGRCLTNRKATFYHNMFVNRTTSSGERFLQTKYTAAHKTIKLNTLVRVTNEKNGRSVIVKVNDRCPKTGVIDLSLIAAKRLKMIKEGVAPVRIEILSDDYIDIWQKQDEIFNMFDRVEEKDSLSSSYINSVFINEPIRMEEYPLLLSSNLLAKCNFGTKEESLKYESSSKYRILVKDFKNEVRNILV